LDHQNNYVENSSNAATNFDILATSLNSHNYFDSSIKLFSNLYLILIVQ